MASRPHICPGSPSLRSRIRPTNHSTEKSGHHDSRSRGIPIRRSFPRVGRPRVEHVYLARAGIDAAQLVGGEDQAAVFGVQYIVQPVPVCHFTFPAPSAVGQAHAHEVLRRHLLGAYEHAALLVAIEGAETALPHSAPAVIDQHGRFIGLQHHALRRHHIVVRGKVEIAHPAQPTLQHVVEAQFSESLACLLHEIQAHLWLAGNHVKALDTLVEMVFLGPQLRTVGTHAHQQRVARCLSCQHLHGENQRQHQSLFSVHHTMVLSVITLQSYSFPTE